jgi:ribosome-binding protein aMBF1 (putative translation factor)
MKHKAKKLMISTIIGLTLSCTATAALADDSTSTTVPSTTKATNAPTRSQTPKVTAAERAEYSKNLKTYIGARFKIVKDFNSSIKEAIEARRIARKAAKTQEERKILREVFATAVETAKTTKADALTALGDPPVKPTK